MPDVSLAKIWDFKNIITEFPGYNSTYDPTKIAEPFVVSGSQNMYKKLSGNWAVRAGQKRKYGADDTISAVSSEFVWNTSWGVTYPLWITNSTLQVNIDDVWYTLLDSLTKTRYVFDKWWDNTLKKDVCLFVNGTTSMFEWSGGYGLVNSTTSNTIVLDRTIAASFLTSSGSVIVNGNTYTYSGSSGSTLTGVSPNPTGEANGSVVLQTVVTHTNKPDSSFNTDFIKVVNNQVYAGSYTSRLCYISSQTDFTDYTVPAPRAPGDPELLTLDATLNGIGVRQGNAYISFGTDSWAAVIFNDITVGTTLTQQTKVDIKPISALQAAYAHEFIDSTGDNIVYLAQDQQIRVVGDFNNSFTPVYPSLSLEISTELQAENFSGGGLRIIGEFTYVTAPATGKMYLYQVRQGVNPQGQVVAERIWHTPWIANATRIDEISGTVVAFSNSNPQVYEIWDTGQFYDDSPSDEPLPYSCVLAFAYRGGQRRQGLWAFDKIFTEGYISLSTPLTLTVNYNYGGALNTVMKVVSNSTYPADTFSPSASSPDSLGDVSLGEETLGESEDTTGGSDLVKFKVINSMPLLNCFEYQIIYSSDAANAHWEILATATNAIIDPDQNATFIINRQP